ncbi:MAG: efflux transporter outer membrane subunit [Planctomycetota bacterium]
MPRTRLFLIVLLFGTVGCGGLRQWRQNGFRVGPDHKRPIVPVAEDWIESEDPSIVYDPCVQAGWWRVFNDPLLEELILTAYQQNLSLRAAGLRVLEARAQRQIAAGNLFPQSQGFFGQYGRNQISNNAANVFPGISRVFDDWQTGFDMSWEIDIWGRLRRSIEAADASIDAEIEGYDDILVTLIGDVAASYIELRSFDERLRLARENVEIQQGSLDIAQARFDQGRVAALDVQQATSNLADTRALIPALQQGRRQTLNGLAILLGMTPYRLESLLSAPGAIPDAPEQAVVGIPADLLRRRPDIRNAERVIAQQSAQIGIAAADLYPQFGINGEIKLNSQDFSDLFSSGSSAGSVIPGFRWNILNYGRIVNNVRVQELRYQQTIVDYENTVLAAHREVEDAMVEFLRSKQRTEALRQSAEAAAKSVELVRIQYKEGATDFGRVFVLEANLVQAQDTLIDSQADIGVALTRLYKALGGGWQLRCDVPYRGCHLIQLPAPLPSEVVEPTPTTSDEEVLPLPELSSEEL